MNSALIPGSRNHLREQLVGTRQDLPGGLGGVKGGGLEGRRSVRRFKAASDVLNERVLRSIGEVCSDSVDLCLLMRAEDPRHRPIYVKPRGTGMRLYAASTSDRWVHDNWDAAPFLAVLLYRGSDLRVSRGGYARAVALCGAEAAALAIRAGQSTGVGSCLIGTNCAATYTDLRVMGLPSWLVGVALALGEPE